MAGLPAGGWRLFLTLGIKELSKDTDGLQEPGRDMMKGDKSRWNFLVPRAALKHKSLEGMEQAWGDLEAGLQSPQPASSSSSEDSSALELLAQWRAPQNFSSSLTFPAGVSHYLSLLTMSEHAVASLRGYQTKQRELGLRGHLTLPSWSQNRPWPTSLPTGPHAGARLYPSSCSS